MSKIIALAIMGVVVCSIALFFLDDIKTNRVTDSCTLASQCVGLSHDDCIGEWRCINGNCVWKCSEEETPAGECTLDSDCATGGCSGEICGLRGQVEDMVTACIYLDSYECLGLTECGCVDGECAWKENEEYLACMAKYE
jgi:eight-cysteine-cluster-containing protein